jgi:outer membrane protein
VEKSRTKSRIERWIVPFLAVVAVYAAVLATINFVKSPKIGYVNSAILMEKYKGLLEVREKIRKETEEGQKNIKTLEAELNQLGQEIIRDGAGWDSETAKGKRQTLANKQDEYARYSRAVSEKAAKLEKDLMQPVYDEVNARISRFGQERGYDLILGTVAGGNILFADRATDLTNEVLAYLNEKK